jgi:cytochrome c553
MRRFVGALVLAAIPMALAAAPPPQQEPDRSWAFPAPDKGLAPEPADSNPRRAPGSLKTYTVAQIGDLNNPPDWFPDENGPKPQIILHGNGGQVCGCGSCHLMSGNGHPQSANLAGQPVAYMLRQLADFKSGARNDQGRMALLGKELSEEQARQAAEWFSTLKPTPGPGGRRRPFPKRLEPQRMRTAAGGGTEPIGNRSSKCCRSLSARASRLHSGLAWLSVRGVDEALRWSLTGGVQGSPWLAPSATAALPEWTRRRESRGFPTISPDRFFISEGTRGTSAG